MFRQLLSITMVFSSLMAVNQAFAGVVSFADATKKHHPKGAVVHLLATPELHGTKSGFMSALSIPAKGGVPEHRDKSEEYLYVLEGKGTMWINDKQYSLKPGDAVFIPANEKVKFQAGKRPVKVLQFFAPPESSQKYNKTWK